MRASVWITTEDGSLRLRALEPVPFAKESTIAPGEFTIDVDDSRRYQTMVGFGATLTDSSAWLIGTRLNAGQRAELMAEAL
jgi:glucosylceramidase